MPTDLLIVLRGWEVLRTFQHCSVHQLPTATDVTDLGKLGVVDELLPLSWKSVRLSQMMILSFLGLAWEKIEGYVDN